MTQAAPVNPFSIDLGKSLQLLQSLLLIVTFIWAFIERKRYRLADRFRALGLTYVTDSLDDFYADLRKFLKRNSAKRDGSVESKASEIDILTSFQTRLFLTRKNIEHRLECFEEIDKQEIEEAFEQIEDDFTIDLSTGAGDLANLEVLSYTVGKGSSRIIRALIKYETELSGHWRTSWFRERVPRH